ncbi:VOC family protein [Eudoraea chungangensis]|uniref:VOC family protein n=1 Tax=Eudoraea chungangensis TaxID=1481905 RepID=UPI0023ECC69C|nr:VOC family protein [Eudoraea chungangensis]
MNLNQITIPSKNLEISLAFYQKLGLKLIVKALPHYLRFECPKGEATFSVHLQDTLPVGQGAYIYFESDELDEAVKRLVKAGISFDELPTDKRWLWREARLKDPDGNLLLLYKAGINRKNPPWRIEDPTTN